MQSAIESEILNTIKQLKKGQKLQVLEYMRSLLGITKSKNEAMLQLAGTIDKESLKEMSNAIEIHCTHIEGYE